MQKLVLALLVVSSLTALAEGPVDTFKENFAKRKDYVSVGLNAGGHRNETPIEKGTGHSSNVSIDAELALKLSEKVNLLLGAGLGLETKTQTHDVVMNNGTTEEFVHRKLYGQLLILNGVTYKITDKLEAGVGIRSYIGEEAATRVGSISALARYRLKPVDNQKVGAIINAEFEINTNDKGFGIRVGASGAAF